MVAILIEDMKYLPLHDEFKRLNASFIPFDKWEVPAYFSSIIDEHSAVRNKAGIFDISHMGFFSITGEDAQYYLRFMCTSNVCSIENNKAKYSLLCNADGGIIDDVFIYKKSSNAFYLIVNAANIEKDFAWLISNSADFDVKIDNQSEQKAIFAIQGPASFSIIKEAFSVDLTKFGFHAFSECMIDNNSFFISTTGYTGELGCEIVFDRHLAVSVWQKLFTVGEKYGLKPIGFGARDTLRLEACCHLYGSDMSEDTNPFEAGLGWLVDFDLSDFIAKDRLLEIKNSPVSKKLICFKMIDRAIARHDYRVFKNGVDIGVVTSGGVAPTVGANIGMAYVCIDEATVDNEIDICVRNRFLKAKIVKRPFYKRA